MSGKGEVLGMHPHTHVGESHRGECGKTSARQGLRWDDRGDVEAADDQQRGTLCVPDDTLRLGSIGDSPEDSEEEPENGGRDHEAESETGAAAGTGVLMELGGFEEGGDGEDAAEQVVIETERGDTTETEGLPSLEEKEEAEQEWKSSRSSLHEQYEQE